MIKETVNIPLSDKFKESVLKKIDKTIDKVVKANDFKLSISQKRKLRNLALDQINVNVSSKMNSRTLWVFSSAKTLPVMVEKDSTVPKANSLITKDNSSVFYSMKSNNSWVVSKNKEEGSLLKEEFYEKVLSLFLEDVETAAFYGASSFIK